MLSKYSALVVAALCVGCGGNHNPATFPVIGKVVFRDGKPTKGVTVKFRTTDRTPAFTASGATDADGKFSFEAAEGENSAIVVPTYPRDTDNMSQAERDRVMDPIDPMFLNYDQSQLKFKVTADSAKSPIEIKVWPPRR